MQEQKRRGKSKEKKATEEIQGAKIEIPNISADIDKIDEVLAQTEKKCKPHRLCSVCYRHECSGLSDQRFEDCHCKCTHKTVAGKKGHRLSAED